MGTLYVVRLQLLQETKLALGGHNYWPVAIGKANYCRGEDLILQLTQEISLG